MALVQNGSLRLFRVAGIDIMIHWSWLVFAAIEYQFRPFPNFQSPLWNALAFLSLFGIVLLHEIGHVTACRQVGGTADRIILWPLGGVAVLKPPPRPGPWFWSIAGGPLVNLVLVPVTIGFAILCHRAGWGQQFPNLEMYLQIMSWINIFLLVYNLLPLFPNDGGQMVYAILWAIVGRWPALMMTSVVGLVAGGAVLVFFVFLSMHDAGWLVMAFFGLMMVMRSVAAFGQARRMMRIMRYPRHLDASCPSCHSHPLKGDHWVCDDCRYRFDTFETLAECPKCFKRFPETLCVECGGKFSIIEWFPRYAAPVASSPAADAATRPLLGHYRATDEWDQHVPRDYS